MKPAPIVAPDAEAREDELRARKRGARHRLHALRDALSPALRERASAAITQAVLALQSYRGAQTVLAYMTFGSEFQTAGFIADALAQGKTLALPRMEKAPSRLVLYAVRDPVADLVPGPWGIHEPHPGRCREIEIADIDFVLVPGLGFSPRGDRLGYGRGYYDRLLAHRGSQTVLAAPAYSAQVVTDIPVGDKDIPLHLVITEDTIHRGPPAPG